MSSSPSRIWSPSTTPPTSAVQSPGLCNQADGHTAPIILLSPKMPFSSALSSTPPDVKTHSPSVVFNPILNVPSQDIQILMTFSYTSCCLAVGCSINTHLLCPLWSGVVSSTSHTPKDNRAQQSPGLLSQGLDFCHSYEILLLLDFWVKKIRGERPFSSGTWGNWWSRNVYSLGTNSPEINEGAIVGGGGTRGGFEGNLKGTQNSAAGLREPSAEFFITLFWL